MQKDPNQKHLGNPGHNEKMKPKDNRYRKVPGPAGLKQQGSCGREQQ